MKNNSNKGFAIVDKNPATIVIDEIIAICGEALSDRAVRVYLVLKRYSNYEEDKLISFISINKIGEKIGRSQPEVDKGIKELEEVGLVVKTKMSKEDIFGHYNVYQLVNIREWWKKIGREIRRVKKEHKLKTYGGGLKKARQIKEIREIDEFREVYQAKP